MSTEHKAIRNLRLQNDSLTKTINGIRRKKEVFLWTTLAGMGIWGGLLGITPSPTVETTNTVAATLFTVGLCGWLVTKAIERENVKERDGVRKMIQEGLSFDTPHKVTTAAPPLPEPTQHIKQ